MTIINCTECDKRVSDKAMACPNCGAPIAEMKAQEAKPDRVHFSDGVFTATRSQLVNHVVKAIQKLNYKVDDANEQSGLVSFTTGVTWGSWSGVSGSIHLEELEQYEFKASGNAKHNVKGGQMGAINIGNESGKKVAKIIKEMEMSATRKTV